MIREKRNLAFHVHRWEPVNIHICAPAQRVKHAKRETRNGRGHFLLLQRARLRMGMTQKQLARICNLHWTIIRDAELGNANVEVGQMDIICRTLNIRY